MYENNLNLNDLKKQIDDIDIFRGKVKAYIKLEVDSDVIELCSVFIEKIPLDDNEEESAEMLVAEVVYKKGVNNYRLDSVIIEDLDALTRFMDNPEVFKNEKKYKI